LVNETICRQYLYNAQYDGNISIYDDAVKKSQECLLSASDEDNCSHNIPHSDTTEILIGNCTGIVNNTRAKDWWTGGTLFSQTQAS